MEKDEDMSIYNRRRDNLLAYMFANFSTQSEFAKHIERSSTQLTKWFADRDYRQNIHGEQAREIEVKLGKPKGWLDEENDIEAGLLEAEQDTGVFDRRREKLLAYMKDNFGTQREFAKHIGKTPVQVTKWFSDKYSETITLKLAREIEGKLGKRRGWLDEVSDIEAGKREADQSMTIFDRRREKLLAYMKDNFDTRTEFAKHIGKLPAQITKWFSSKYNEKISEKTARELEVQLNQPTGWLDEENDIEIGTLASEDKAEDLETGTLQADQDTGVFDRRREKLLEYMKASFITQRGFAKHIGKSATQVNKWFLDTKNRQPIGERLAREIEVKLNQPTGWLDEVSDLKSLLKEHYSCLNQNVNVKDAAIAVKILLENYGYQVIDVPAPPSGALMVINDDMWGMPSLIVNATEKSKSFYIDIMADERNINYAFPTENNQPEILFIKDTEVIHVARIVQAHIEKWFF